MAVIMIRLDKYLADMGIGTRTEVKKYIRQGKVKVDGIVVKTPEKKVDVQSQDVLYMDQPIGYEDFEYFMLHMFDLGTIVKDEIPPAKPVSFDDFEDKTPDNYGLSGSATQVERIFPPEKNYIPNYML
mgnify:CR=1 FL=1